MKVILKQEEIKLKESSDKSDKLLKELEIENKKAKEIGRAQRLNSSHDQI